MKMALLFHVDMNVAVSFKNRFELGAGYWTNASLNLLQGIYVLKILKRCIVIIK